MFTIVIFLSMIIATVFYNKGKVQSHNTRSELLKISVYALAPLSIYYVIELLFKREQELFVIFAKTPSIFLFYLGFIWIFSNKKNNKSIVSFAKVGLFLSSLIFYLISVTCLSIMPHVLFIENPSTKEKAIIEERFSIKLPEKNEGDIVLSGMSFMQGTEYYVLFEMKEDEWSQYKQSIENTNYKLVESKKEGRVIVKIYGDERSRSEFNTLLYENGSLWNGVVLSFKY